MAKRAPKKQAPSLPQAMEVRMVDVASLELDPTNLRKHDARSLKALANALSMPTGQVEPLVVQKSRQRVIGGNGRLQAMHSLGWKQCAIVEVDCDDEQARVLSIVLNRTAELSDWEDDVTAEIDAIIDSLDDAEIAFLLDELQRELTNAGGRSREQAEGEDDDKPDVMELRPNEHYDYLIVLCRSTQEWHTLLDRLGIEPKSARGKKRRYGSGRAIAGAKLVALLDGGNG